MNKSKFLERDRDVHGYKYMYIDIPEKITYRDYIKIEIDNINYIQRVNKHLEKGIQQDEELWGRSKRKLTNG